MLFRVYSRYVPDLSGRDGHAFEQMLADSSSSGLPSEGAGGKVGIHTMGRRVMVHVTEYADCGELMWATRLADSEGEYECWELLSPKAVHRVSGLR